MKKFDVGQTIGILANLGVIAGIVFLGIEVRQNNTILRAEAVGAVLETRMARSELNLSSPHLVELLVKNSRGEALSDEEEYTLRAMLNRNLLGWQRDYLLFQAGILDEDWVVTNLGTMKAAFRVRDGVTLAEHWESREGPRASPSFRRFIEQCVISDCDTIPK